MNANGKSLTIVNGVGAAAFHTRSALVALAMAAVVAGGVLASLWAASFFLYASLRMNPLHAGLWGWPDVSLAWLHGQKPNAGRRLAGAALLGVLTAVGGPAIGLYTLWESTGRRRLYGSARFASEAEIRAAGLL
ncbi:hypothetical protein H3O04_00685 [Burkholderia sp. KCJ3K979]|uniref:hypothetical protein n=1 Tax=Burkholderia sp. KCJ3K979 TaxID=2759149 RepID=UPI001929D6AE|nr:hypothetical protein [Burkholderia sp. KCJ3K979]MBL3961018.1 hypothetical protein [Burkholderia sp. KCJ3K979]